MIFSTKNSLTVRNDETRNSNIIDIRSPTNIDPYVTVSSLLFFRKKFNKIKFFYFFKTF